MSNYIKTHMYNTQADSKLIQIYNFLNTIIF